MKKNYMKIFFATLTLSSLIFVSNIFSSEEDWVVNDIRLSGLQRVSAGSVFNVMPIAVGDTVNLYDLQTTVKEIFKTGQFDDIQLGREANTLIISLVERPSIASIELDGNKALKTEDLMRGLNDAGLSQGQVFKRSVVNSLALEIQRQYVSQGRYGAKVDVTSKDEPRNRVSLDIEIDEENNQRRPERLQGADPETPLFVPSNLSRAEFPIHKSREMVTDDYYEGIIR